MKSNYPDWICRGAALWLLLSLFSGCLQSQSVQKLPVIVPDRPGVYTGSLAVPTGIVQLEGGFGYESIETGNFESERLFFPLMLRLGLGKRLELRVSTDSVSRLEQESAELTTLQQTGFAAPNLGVKWNFLTSENRRPSMALIFALDLPVGSRFARPQEVEPSLNLATDFALLSALALTTNLGVEFPVDAAPGGRFSQILFAAALGRALTQSTGLFVEIAGAYPDVSDGELRVLIDGGLTYLLYSDVQLDVSLTRGLSDETPSVFD